MKRQLAWASCMLALLGLTSLAGCEGDPATPGDGGHGGDTSGQGGSAGQGGSGGAPSLPPDVKGCSDDVTLFQTPEDPAARGPWPVGVRTATVSGLTVEIWYPAEIGSDTGEPEVTYDLRQWLPESEMGKIPDEAAPSQTCGCHRDLPLDAGHGPYPVVVFLHGTAGFRTQSLAHMEHWASRGFVVLAADHPGLYLGDALDFNLTNDLPADTQTVLDAVAAPTGDLAFLDAHLDITRIGLSGHSAGGGGIKGLGDLPGVRVLMPLAAGGVDPSPTLESTLVMGGVDDQVVAFTEQQDGYMSSAPKKRLVGLAKSGHLFPTDLCWMTNPAGQSIVETAVMYDIKNANLASGLFDCPEDQLPQDKQRSIVNYATTAALEETLTCKPGNPFDAIQATYPDVEELQEALR